MDPASNSVPNAMKTHKATLSPAPDSPKDDPVSPSSQHNLSGTAVSKRRPLSQAAGQAVKSFLHLGFALTKTTEAWWQLSTAHNTSMTPQLNAEAVAGVEPLALSAGTSLQFRALHASHQDRSVNISEVDT